MTRSAGIVTVEQSFDWHNNLLRGQGAHPAFGRRLSIPVNSTVDVWAGAAANRPLPLAPKPMFLVSTSASDTFGVGGAQLVLVTFIDEFGDWRNSDLIPMTGLANAAITYKPTDGILGDASRPPTPPSPPGPGSVAANIFRVQDATVLVALGATEDLPKASNIGEIRVVDGGAKVFEVIPAQAGRSRSAAFHCPRNHLALLVYSPFGTDRGSGVAVIGTNYGFAGGAPTAWSRLPVSSVDSTTAMFDADSAITPVYPRADVQGMVITSSNSIDVSFMLQFRLERA